MISPIDIDFLRGLVDVVDDKEVGIVCGGGKIAREYQDAAKRIRDDFESLEQVGIAATRLNAELVRGLLGWKGVFHDPNRAAEEFPGVVCAGWKPGRTTDYVSAFLASLVEASVINVTNVDYVYDKDPNKHKDAKPIEKLGWKEMIGICGTEHKPGISAPFAPVACKFAMEKGLKVIIVGKDLKNLKSLLDGKEFVGTIVE